MKKKNYAITLNIILIILEVIGLIVTLVDNHKLDIQYYTIDSNVFALIVSTIYLYYLLKDKESKLISIIKYTSVLCLSITFLVVIFVLAPMYNFNYKWFLFNGDFVFYHFLCPIISFISFMFFENHDLHGLKDNIRAMYPTLIYSIVLIILNIIGIVTGPYPFLEVKNNGVVASIIWFVLLISSMFGLSNLITFIKHRKIK